MWFKYKLAYVGKLWKVLRAFDNGIAVCVCNEVSIKWNLVKVNWHSCAGHPYYVLMKLSWFVSLHCDSRWKPRITLRTHKGMRRAKVAVLRLMLPGNDMPSCSSKGPVFLGKDLPLIPFISAFVLFTWHFPLHPFDGASPRGKPYTQNINY